MSTLFYHKELSDKQWKRIKCLFEKTTRVGRTSLNPRMVFNGILWILKSGGRWRDLPTRYGTAFIINSVSGVNKAYLSSY